MASLEDLKSFQYEQKFAHQTMFCITGEPEHLFVFKLLFCEISVLFVVDLEH